MEERKEEGEAEIQEHGPEHWFSKWERQCLAEAEQDEQLPPELQEEAAAGAQPEHKQQKLWHLFQNSATAVAQLYKGEGRRRHLAAAASARPSAEGPGRPPRPGRRPAAPSSQDGGAGAGPRGRLGPARGRFALGAGPEEPARSVGLAVGGPGPGRVGEEPPVTKWRREATGLALLCPKPAPGRGRHLLAPRLGLGLRPGPRGSPFTPPRPLFCLPPSHCGMPKPWNKMAKPNMAVPE